MEQADKLLIEIDQRCRSNTHRLDRLEKVTDAIGDLAASMKIMAVKQEQVADTVTKLDGKVEALEAKPGKRYEGLVEKIIWACVAAVITYVLSHVGL